MAITLNGTLGVTSPGFEPTSNTVPVSGFYLPSANTVGLVTGSTERVRIDSSGNVGIGTTSPLSRLDIGGASVTDMRLTVGGDTKCNFYASASNVTLTAVPAIPLVFGTNNAERMRLDSSGNLGLGVTPNTWSSSGKAIQTSAYSLLGYSNTIMHLYQNGYLNASGNDTYVNTAAASLYRMSGAQHTWYNAPSGTAGNPISWTQAMTLDASGNLGIGTTSPVTRLSLLAGTGASNGITLQASGWPYYGRIGMNGTAGSEQYWTANYSFASTTVDSASYYSTYILQSVASGVISFGTSSAVNTAPTERARIDSSGRLLVGTTSVPGSLGNLYAIVNQGVSVINSGTTTAFFQVYNSNAGTDLKTWRLGNTDNTGALVLQSVNDVYTSANERLRVDASGRMTVPGQPAFYAVPPANYTLNGGDQTISGTWSEITDRSNSFNNGTFTAPVSGFYYFTWSSFVTSTSTRNDAYILVNGAMKARSEISGYAAGTTNRSSMVSVGVYLSANDNVTVGVYINGTGNTYTSQPPWGNFSGFLVG